MYRDNANETAAYVVEALLGLTADVYRWHSEVRYNLHESGATRLLRSFELHRRDFETTLEPHTNRLEAYKKSAFALWRSYRLAEAKPLLETIARLDPDEPDAAFWLAQLHEDGLGDLAGALARYEAFVARWPSLLPPNNWLVDGWFTHHHGYDPSTLEALVAIGRIHLAWGDRTRAKEYFTKAVRLAPMHHLAPWVALADLRLGEDPTSFREVLGFYRCAIRAFRETKWDAWPYDKPCSYFDRLEAWANERYPFSYRWHSLAMRRFFDKLAALLPFCTEQRTAEGVLRTMLSMVFPESRRESHLSISTEYDQKVGVVHPRAVLSSALAEHAQRFGRDESRRVRRSAVNVALEGYGRIRRVVRGGPYARLYSEQVKLVFEHQRDYPQVEDLSKEILAHDPENAQARFYLAAAREKLGRTNSS